MRKSVWLINFLIIGALSLHAQPRHSFNSFTRENGLTSSTIQDMAQDRAGCLWLASWGGLYRFDGERFDNFKTTALNERGNPRSNRFIQIEEDGEGRIWTLAFDNSLYYMEPREGVLHLSEVPGVTFSRIFKLVGGEICIAATDNSFFFPDFGEGGDSSGFVRIRNIPAGASLNALYKDRKGYLWSLTGSGLYRDTDLIDPAPVYCALERPDDMLFGSDDGTVLSFRDGSVQHSASRLKNRITLLAQVPGRDDLLLGSTDEGVYLYDASLRPVSYAGPVAYPAGELQYVSDGRGNLWIVSAAGGLDWYNPEANRLVPFYNTAKQQGWDHESRIGCVMVDSQGDLWISSHLGGLEEVIIRKNQFRFKSFSPDGLVTTESSVRALCEGADGTLLAATRDGRVHLLDSWLNPLGRAQLAYTAYSMVRDSSGTIWAGLRGGGLATLRNPGRRLEGPVETWLPSAEYYGPVASEIYYLFEDSRHRLWIGSFDDGLSYVDLLPAERLFISKKNRLTFPTEERNRLRCIRESAEGALYVGGQIGLFVCDNPDAPPEEMHFQQFSRIQNYDIQDVVLSRGGKLYVCSYGNGFLEFDSLNPDSGFREYTVEDGFLSNFILSAVEDHSGTLWIATEGGLNRFDPETGSIVGYSYERLGFPMRFNEGAILAGSDGNLYFNTNAGIFYFNPEQVSNSSYVPTLHLVSCRAGKQEYGDPSGALIRLKAGEQLHLQYLAIDMAAPGRVLYSYSIDGQEWTQVGTRNQLDFGPLRRGRHRIQLRSTNGDGVNVDNVRTLEVLVSPPLAATGGAFILYAVAAAAAALFFLLRRRRGAGDAPASEENPYLRGLQGNDRKLVADLLALLGERIDDGALNMDTMAEAMNMSRSALFKRTKSLTGKSPMDILRGMRLERAAALLVSGGYPVAQIAYMTGFNDTHYFSKVFKKETGLTPTEYRESAKKKETNNITPSS